MIYSLFQTRAADKGLGNVLYTMSIRLAREESIKLTHGRLEGRPEHAHNGNAVRVGQLLHVLLWGESGFLRISKYPLNLVKN